MTTLVIHPNDPTTAFLGHIYFDKDCTIFDHSTSKKHLKEAIKAHDRIIMLGHGSEYGMFGYGRFVIDSSWVYLLRQKQIVAIWCNADIFVKKYGLKGLYTGMIISDSMEANFYMINESGSDIDDSNKLFAEAMKKAIENPLETAVADALSIYKKDDNAVVNFNRKNIYENETRTNRCLHD